MEIRDIIVTPFVIILTYALAYLIRPRFTDEITRRYFIPALTFKIIAAVALGFLYQFYYHGGDTYTYHTHGSRHIWDAFMDDPSKGFALLGNTPNDPGVYRYSSKIIFITDPHSYSVVKLAAIIDLFTFSTYSATAVLFCVISFMGVWLLFLTFYEIKPSLHKGIALATLFIPSVIFWGSGLLKDTITLGCLGLATFCVYRIFIRHKPSLMMIVLLLFSFYMLSSIKVYILLAFLPSAIVWILMFHYRLLNSFPLKLALFPVVVVACGIFGFFAVQKAGEDNPKYSMQAIAKTAQVTAYDIRYWSGRDAGSGYTLGELDGTWKSMIKLAPQAINVSLFRPYLWETKNLFMFFAALESLGMLSLTLYTLKLARLKFFRAFADPMIMFCMIFSIMFAFSVGVSTYNFGTLMRYKIPLMPFYTVAMIFIIDYAKRVRNVERFEETE